jgi:CRP/FNR family cyclic AMP-dependent transcriptional regulator
VENQRPPAGGYNAGIAMEFFRIAGKAESVAQGETIFAENEKTSGFLKRAKMYLVLDGEVSLLAGGKVIGTVRTGEILGEMASIGQATRSATAVAVRACRLITLDDKQFKEALQKKPDFALMMMSLITGRIRGAVGRIAESTSSGAQPSNFQVIDKKLVAELANELGDEAVINYDKNKVIMHEGQAGVLMYIVLKGQVAISLKGRIAQRIGQGGFFGEMALVERSPRLASALAETDCSLLGINRNAFLSLVQARPDFGLAILNAMGERARFVTSQLK